MSKIEIINRALLKLGEPPISSLNDAAFGQSYGMIYDDVKNLLLSAYPWRFAVVSKKLPRSVENYGSRAMYRLPADCMLLLKVFGAETSDLSDFRMHALQSYEIADNSIVTMAADGIDIEYVKKTDDDAFFPPLFREAMAAKIAAELAMRLNHSVSIKQVFDNEFYNLIRQAEMNNEIVKTVELLPDNSWVKIRQAWH